MRYVKHLEPCLAHVSISKWWRLLLLSLNVSFSFISLDCHPLPVLSFFCPDMSCPLTPSISSHLSSPSLSPISLLSLFAPLRLDLCLLLTPSFFSKPPFLYPCPFVTFQTLRRLPVLSPLQTRQQPVSELAQTTSAATPHRKWGPPFGRCSSRSHLTLSLLLHVHPPPPRRGVRDAATSAPPGPKPLTAARLGAQGQPCTQALVPAHPAFRTPVSGPL